MDPLLSIKQFTSSSPITHSFSTPNIFRGFFCCPVNMYRTASVSRVSDEYLLNMSPAASKVGSPSPNPKLLYIAASDDDGDDFHVRTPILDAEKKVGSPMKKSTSGEKAVHLIPVVLILCALILWLFSKPVSP